MRRICRFLPSVRTKRSWSSLAHSTCAGSSAWPSSSRPWRSSASDSGESSVPGRCRDAHEVFLLDLAVGADQLLGDTAVLRQHEQAHRVDVEPSRRNEASQVLRQEADARGVVAPLPVGRDQHARRLVAVLGLSADVADRLVDQDRDELRLLVTRARVDRDLLPRHDARAQLAHDPAVDADPAARDPLVGLAPRRQAELAHPLRQAQAAVAVRRGRAGRPLRRRRRAGRRWNAGRHRPRQNRRSSSASVTWRQVGRP